MYFPYMEVQVDGYHVCVCTCYIWHGSRPLGPSGPVATLVHSATLASKTVACPTSTAVWRLQLPIRRCSHFKWNLKILRIVLTCFNQKFLKGDQKTSRCLFFQRGQAFWLRVRCKRLTQLVLHVLPEIFLQIKVTYEIYWSSQMVLADDLNFHISIISYNIYTYIHQTFTDFETI